MDFLVEKIGNDNWDLEYFKSIPSFKGRVQYAREKLGHIGSGSSRIVFDSGPGKVLKIAKNKKGIAQNELEVEISAFGSYDDFLTVVLEHDPEYFWIEVEKAEKMKKSEFKKLTGYNFNVFAMALINEASKNRGKKMGLYYIDPSEARKIYSDPLFNKILSFIEDFDLTVGDFGRISSWGVVTRKGKGQIPVLIDYGVSRGIFKDFYLKK